LETSTDIQTSYELLLEKGEVRSKLTGWRMMLMSTDSWKSLQAGLYRKFPDNASLIILEMGFDYGTHLASAILGARDDLRKPTEERHGIQSSIPSPQALGALLRETMLRVGWGVLSISGDLNSGSAISFRVENCGFCSTGTRYPCNFLRGAIVGLAVNVYSREYLSSASCSDKDQTHVCQIHLTSK